MREITLLGPEEIKRYQRQILLPEIGEAGQKRLLSSRVLCFGAGGLGSPTLLYLAAAGVGHLGIVDSDAVELSNLHRQIIHASSRLGMPKPESAFIQLKDLNPNIEIECFKIRVTSKNIAEIINQYDIIVDGTDNFPTRYLINDACVMMKKPNIYGAIHRFEGQASVFASHLGGPCYRCLYPEPPPPGVAPSCAEAGVLGVLPGIVGSIQATETIKLLLGKGTSLIGRLLCLDALNMKFRELKVRKDPECPACGNHPTITSLKDIRNDCALAIQTSSDTDEISVAELRKIITDTAREIKIIDVRERFEHQLNPFKGAEQIPLAELPGKIGQWDKNLTIYLICRSGIRSKQAQQFLQSQGFQNVKNVHGGLMAWTQELEN